MNKVIVPWFLTLAGGLVWGAGAAMGDGVAQASIMFIALIFTIFWGFKTVKIMRVKK